MKTKHFLFSLSIFAVLCMSGCVEDYSITVSTQDLRFGLEAESQTMIVNANCKWTVTKNDDADWYTVSPMSGRANDSIITVTVKDYSDGDFRGSSFVISSPGGHVYRTVFVSQNKLDFDGMINKVFGVMSVEHWNTDYYGMMVEDSYKHYEYDPYDTATGYTMFFLADGTGVQMDHHEDTAVYYAFTYEYHPEDQILHIEFETVTDAPESYDPEVLTASDSLYRFFHEYKPNWWERGDMRKIGTIDSGEKSLLMRAVKKRKDIKGVFQF